MTLLGSQRPGYGWPCGIERQEAEGGENKSIQTMLFFPLNKSGILQFPIVSFSHLTKIVFILPPNFCVCV